MASPRPTSHGSAINVIREYEADRDRCVAALIRLLAGGKKGAKETTT